MKKKLLFALPLFGLALTSCSFINILSSSSAPAPSSSTEPASSFVPVTYDSLYENYVKNAIYEQSAIPTSVKETKFLVIPVWFTDSSSLVNEEASVVKDRIQKAFFGTTEETGWHSVKTYYEAESHGHKTIEGVVSDWYQENRRLSYYAGSYDERDRTAELVADAVNWFFESNPSENRTDYDRDGDGYLDALSVVYAAPNYSNHSYGSWEYRGERSTCTNFWAYVDWTAKAEYKNVNKPGPCAYLWASYDFATQDISNCTVDAHAYIHETGHLFGLEDYYDYTNSALSPAGGFSMQDYNVGGHDPYSIIGLGWGSVNVPTETGTFTLKPFESSGEVILLSNNYSDSIFDEYLLLEYYTPTGVNAFDTAHQYSKKNPQGVSTPGIRLWHVDSRLIYRNNGQWNETGITTEVTNEHEYRLLCTNNSPTNNESIDTSPLSGRGNYARYRLLNLLRRSDPSGRTSGANFASRDLFVAGDQFDMTKYARSFVERGRLNSGHELGWSFSVDAISEEGATITVTKTA